MELCKPALAILLVSIAGGIYHLIMGDFYGIIWWLMVGLLGTGVFQGLCYGNLEPVAWVLMGIPVLIVCFFLAVALFASSMRINNVRKVPCDGCNKPKEECGGCPRPAKKPHCNKPRPCACNSCSLEHGYDE
jgi:hypothetical protein